MGRLASWGGVLAGLGIAFACGREPLDPGTGVRAEVRRGPISPVEQEGVENTAPVGTAAVSLRRSGDEAARAVTGPGGFAILLARPGAYDVIVRECPGALGLPAPAEVRVTAGALADVRLVCDTGIR